MAEKQKYRKIFKEQLKTIKVFKMDIEYETTIIEDGKLPLPSQCVFYFFKYC